MNREILFRAKSTHENKWVYGNFIHSKRFEGCPNEFRIHEQETGLESDVDPETVGQWTGLKDKNGTMIFEGDIVGENQCRTIGTVYFRDGSFMSKNEHGRDFIWALFYGDAITGMNANFLEVIGSIHDNPSLLQ